LGPDGTIYACNLEGTLYAVNPAGRKIWSLDTGSGPSGDPSVSDSGTIYLILNSGKLIAVSHTGRLRWAIETGTEPVSSPTVAAGEAVFITDQTGTVFCYTPWGSLLWTKTEQAGGRSVPVHPGTLAVHEHLLYTTWKREVSALTLNGNLLWQKQLPADSVSMVIFRGGLFCVMTSGSAAAYSFDGNQLWIRDGAAFRDFPAASDEGIYLLQGRDEVALISEEGEFIDKYREPGAFLSQPVLSGGMMITGSEEWIVYAFNAVPPSDELWAQKGRNASHSGTWGEAPGWFNESMYSTNFDYLYLRELLDSGDIERKKEALAEIGERIAADTSDRGESYMLPLLHRALNEGRGRVFAGGSRFQGDYPLVRAEAARLISEFGTFDSIEVLISVLGEEEDDLVSAEIISALGKLGSDFEGKTLAAIYRKITKDRGNLPNNKLGAFSAEAISNIISYNGVPKSDFGYMTLIHIYSGNYSSVVRSRAHEILRSIK
jgi:outer membrane protein assembly factor BamB